MRRARRAQLRGGRCADLAAVAEKLEQVFEKPAVCVLAPRAELERCSLDEVLGL